MASLYWFIILRFPHLLLHNNDNELSNKTQEEAGSDTVPQRHKDER